MTSGDLFERDAEEAAAEAAAEDLNIDVAIENYEPALEALVAEEEVEVAAVLEDETLDGRRSASRSGLSPKAQDKEIEQRVPRRVHCSGCCNHDGR